MEKVDEGLSREYLRLPETGAVHVTMRDVGEDFRFVVAFAVDTRRVTGSLRYRNTPTETAADTLPYFLGEFCRAHISLKWRPAAITTHDVIVAGYVRAQLPGTTVRALDENTMPFRGTPISAIADAVAVEEAADIDRQRKGQSKMCRLSEDGEDLLIPTTGVKETFRERKSRAGAFKSTVSGNVPPRFHFCSSPRCQRLVTADQVKRCGQCRIAVYCSKACQVRHWKHDGHKAACPPAAASSRVV